MIPTLDAAFGRDVLLQAYMALCIATMIGPMVVLTIWHNLRLKRSAGGRRLAKDNQEHAANPRSGVSAARGLAGAVAMARDISAGRYGADARRVQNRTYVLVLIWVAVNFALWSVPIVGPLAPEAVVAAKHDARPAP